MRTTFNWSIWITCFLFFLWTGLAIASPPPLPIAGDLTDQEGKPLNETVTLTFYLTESETSDQVLWSEKHDNVTVKQGRFAVLLGSRRDLLDDESPIDFTQKKYIKVEVEIKRDGKEESYSLTPPLLYMPALGAWQSVHADRAKHAVQADNTAKLEGHEWNDIEKIKETIYSEIKKLREETFLPSGTVIAFDRNECPAGWQPFAEGRTIIGVGQGKDLTMRNLKDQGGVERVTLTLDEIPSHRHQIPTFSAVMRHERFIAGYQATDTLGNYSDHQRPTQEVGGGQPHENMPPFIALRLCRKN